MSLHPGEIPPIPEETRCVAQAAFRRGNRCMCLRDELGTIYDDHLFAPLFPAWGQPAALPWRLALTTVLQFAEDLSDRQAADAVRRRMDWKYTLSMLAARHLLPSMHLLDGGYVDAELLLLTVWSQTQHEAIQAARQRQDTAEFTAQYAWPAGIEGMHTQAIWRCSIRHCRYRSLTKSRV